MNRVNLFLLSIFTCVGWRGECLAGNDPGLSSTNELQEWTLEKQETEQVTFRFADNLLKFRPLINNAARVIRSVGIAHEVPELVYLPRKVPDYVLKKEKDGYLNVRGFTRRLTQVNTQIATGTDGTYPLYEDEGTNYNYEKGAYSCIRLFGDDTHSTLVIGKRSGKYEGDRTGTKS